MLFENLSCSVVLLNNVAFSVVRPKMKSTGFSSRWSGECVPQGLLRCELQTLVASRTGWVAAEFIMFSTEGISCLMAISN
jgi:hypothetical protein